MYISLSRGLSDEAPGTRTWHRFVDTSFLIWIPNLPALRSTHPATSVLDHSPGMQSDLFIFASQTRVTNPNIIRLVQFHTPQTSRRSDSHTDYINYHRDRARTRLRNWTINLSSSWLHRSFGYYNLAQNIASC